MKKINDVILKSVWMSPSLEFPEGVHLIMKDKEIIYCDKNPEVCFIDKNDLIEANRD